MGRVFAGPRRGGGAGKLGPKNEKDFENAIYTQYNGGFCTTSTPETSSGEMCKLWPVERPVRALPDEEADGEDVEEDAHRAHAQHHDPLHHVAEGLHSIKGTYRDLDQKW